MWVLRLAGGLLLIAGWLVVSVHEIGSAYFIVDTLVLGALGAYGFVAAAADRRAAVDAEKKLRLRLLVHNMELENSAMRDDLTHLFNRPYLFDHLERELQTAKNLERPLAVITIDLDSLKSVNETHGHRVGDKALANFGRFLLDYTRATDVPARIGGDEFAIVLPDTSKQGAQTMVERLTRGLEKRNLMDEDELSIRLAASFGIAGYPWSGDTADSIMQHADISMHASKQADAGVVPAIFRKSTELSDNALNAGGPQP